MDQEKEKTLIEGVVMLGVSNFKKVEILEKITSMNSYKQGLKINMLCIGIGVLLYSLYKQNKKIDTLNKTLNNIERDEQTKGE